MSRYVATHRRLGHFSRKQDRSGTATPAPSLITLIKKVRRKEKKKRLEVKGWKIGTLGLSEEESAYIELKIRLAEGVPQRK